MSNDAVSRTFSEFLRTPNEVLATLDGTAGVVLTRRNAPALRLTQESASRSELGALGVVGQLFAASLDEAALDRVATRLSGPLPWIELLPRSVHAQFVAEFQSTARACIDIGRFDRLTIMLEAWKATAEAYADPQVTATGVDLEYLDTAEVASAPDSTA